MAEPRKLKDPIARSPALPARMYGHDESASAWYALSTDLTGKLITQGSALLVRSFNISGTGTNTLTSVASGMRIYKAFLSMEEDTTGHVFMELGNNEIGRVRNPIVGGNHILVSANPDFEYLTATGTLKVSLPTATSVVAATVTLHYTL